MDRGTDIDGPGGMRDLGPRDAALFLAGCIVYVAMLAACFVALVWAAMAVRPG